ncbi:MAG: hypothetical protein ACFB0G_06375 [Leptolyngbyaceae cyanobacterium]
MSHRPDPRHDQWLITAHFLEATYLSPQHAVDWLQLSAGIPAASYATIHTLVSRIKASQDLTKGDRMFVIMLQLFAAEPAGNGATAIAQLQHHLNTVETTFVPWQIVLENQKRNHHEAETDPIKLANQYRLDSTRQAIQDARAGIPPAQRDQFYRGIMKPPSETAVRRNVFPGKAIYGLTGHLITVDEASGAMQIQRVGAPYQSTLTGLWFDPAYFQSMPQRPYEFQKAGLDGKNVWDEYVFNAAADVSHKKS